MLVLINNKSYPDFIQGSLQISNQTVGVRSCSISFNATLPIIKDGDELEIFDFPKIRTFKTMVELTTYQS